MEDDTKFIWAAYKKDTFDERFMPKDMDVEEFKDRLLDFLMRVSRVLTIEVDNRPVGIFMIKDNEWIEEPHVQWFPWASDRNKIEAVVKLLDNIRRTPWMGDIGPEFKGAIVRSNKEDIKFFTHIAKYGILRRIGKSEVMGADGDEALFETKRIG